MRIPLVLVTHDVAIALKVAVRSADDVANCFAITGNLADADFNRVSAIGSNERIEALRCLSSGLRR